ncbi:MAG: E3 ubiquitin ligase family protein [Nanoarchaeota archaeon]|nr:E3 ubiquitin ligase family protein [Nanoarchaeota archaeon]
MADEGDIFIGSIIGFFLGLFFFYKGFVWFRLKRLIENMPTSKVRSLAMGLVEVFGEVVPYNNQLLASPLSKKKCVYYDFRIEEERGSGKNRHWVTLAGGTDMLHFILKDDTGQVLVDPKGAEIDAAADLKGSSGLIKSSSPLVAEYLAKRNIRTSFLGLNSHLRYHEKYIEPKDKVYILGTADDNPFVDEATSQKNEADIMIQKGKNEKIYYISDSSEKGVVKGLAWKAIGGLLGGGILSVVCLAVILLYAGLW